MDGIAARRRFVARQLAAEGRGPAHNIAQRPKTPAGVPQPSVAQRMQMLAVAWAANHPVTLVVGPRACGSISAIASTAKASGVEHKHVVVDPFDPSRYSQLGIGEGQTVANASVLQKAVMNGQALIVEVDADPSSQAATTFVAALIALFDEAGNLPMQVKDRDGTEWTSAIKRHANARVFVVLNENTGFSVARGQ